MDKWTDIGDCRVAFTTENRHTLVVVKSLLRLKLNIFLNLMNVLGPVTQTFRAFHEPWTTGGKNYVLNFSGQLLVVFSDAIASLEPDMEVGQIGKDKMLIAIQKILEIVLRGI